jgi:hypothetical protein
MLVQPTTSVEPSQLVPAAAPEPDPKVSQKDPNQVGHADDYSWVTGHLSYVHVEGGRWVLRYAGVDQADKYGGSVVLGGATEMKNYREGDLVCIRGEMLNEGRPSRYLGGPLYRVNSITMIERAD